MAWWSVRGSTGTTFYLYLPLFQTQNLYIFLAFVDIIIIIIIIIITTLLGRAI
jgi:hypothetical protein